MPRTVGYTLSMAFGGLALIACLVHTHRHAWAQQGGSTCGKYMLQYLDIARTDTGEIVAVTPETAPDIIADLAACVDEELVGDKRTDYLAAIEELAPIDSADRAKKAERQLIELNVAGFFVETDAARHATALAWTVQRTYPPDGFGKAVARNGAKSVLGRFNSPDKHKRDKQAMADYLKNCRSLMPVPDRLEGKGQGVWEGPIEILDNKDDYEKGLILSTTAKFNNLWIYRVAGLAKNESDEKPGVCVVFERFFGGKGPDGFGQNPIGTICTNPLQTEACFFDNLLNAADGSEPLLAQEDLKTTSYADLVPPARIKNICSACHVGQNPFVVTPKSVLGGHFQTLFGNTGVQKNYHIVDEANLPLWHNPPEFVANTKNEAACISCHNLPVPRRPDINNPAKSIVLPGYCGLLGHSAKFTMPPNADKLDKAWWNDGDETQYNATYIHAIRALEKLCDVKPLKK